MITKNRIEKAFSALANESETLRAHVRAVESILAGNVLDRQNGKTISARLKGVVAAAYGIEAERLTNGETYYPGVNYRPGRYYGEPAHVEITTPLAGWGSYDLELVPDADGRLDAAATRAAWLKHCELVKSWAAHRDRARAHLQSAAAVYNEIEGKARELFRLLGDGPNGCITTTLTAFRGQIHERLNAFRWNERDVPAEMEG